MDVSLTLALRREEKGFEISLSARSSDCRSASGTFSFPDAEVSRNPEKDLAAIKSALEKSTGDYCCSVKELKIAAPGGNEQAVPHLAVSRINEMRRGIVELLDATEPLRSPSLRKMPSIEPSVEPRPLHPLMRSKYCLKYELGICRKHPSSHPSIPVPAPGPLYLKNNGKTLELQFDCANCEMLVI